MPRHKKYSLHEVVISQLLIKIQFQEYFFFEHPLIINGRFLNGVMSKSCKTSAYMLCSNSSIEPNTHFFTYWFKYVDNNIIDQDGRIAFVEQYIAT